jgi:hypothetical protein
VQHTPSVTSRLRLVAVALAAASSTLLWARQAPAPQFTTPRPAAATNSVNILGTVSTEILGTVSAAQAGPWTMQIGPGSTVALVTPQFLTPKTAYHVTWTDGSTEDIRVIELNDGGWVLAESAHRAGRAWINLAQARVISPVR